jgi:hypothetical protein
MAPNPPAGPTPAEIVAGLQIGDLSSTAAAFAGLLKGIRESSPEQMAAAKAGTSALRGELEQWRKADLAARRAAGDGAGDPLAAFMNAGKAAVTKGE